MASGQSQRSETRDEALCRLAAEAQRRGVQVYRTPDGRYWATSISQPGALHYVTGVSCDCVGFVRHQRCTHHSALLAHLGWLPVSPDPTPAPAAAEQSCHSCRGYGQVRAENRVGRIEVMTCWMCDGTGVAPATLIAA